MTNQALAIAQTPERVDHRSFERLGKPIEPTVKMGPVSTAIERRALRDGRSGAMHVPVTSRGQLNAAIREMRGLALYIERGRAFIGAETEKLAAVALTLASVAGHRIANLTKLQRATGSLGRERSGQARQERTRDFDRVR